MTEENVTSASDTAPRSWWDRLRVAGPVLFVLAMLFYMERVPVALRWPFRILFFAAVIWLVFVMVRGLMGIRFNGRKVIFSLILGAFLYGALFLICHVFIKLMSAKDSRITQVDTTSLSERARRGINAMFSGESPSLYDRDVGWVSRPDYSWKMHSIGPQGLRGQRVYPETPPDPEKRILCIGDSFTFGYEVEDNECYPWHGEQLLPDSEWINLGINGAGLTQSLLQYRKNGRKFGGRYVVIGFMTNNNKRTVNCFRSFISRDDAMTPLTKPFARINEAGEFFIEPNPYQDIEDYRQLLANEPEELGKLIKKDYFTWGNQYGYQRGSANPIIRTIRYIWEYRYMGRNLDILLNRPVDQFYGGPRPGDDPYGRALWHPSTLR